MSAAVAFVVLVHTDPPKVRRLLATLNDADVFLHCDRRTAAGALSSMIPADAPSVTLVDRIAPKLGSWSLVEAELRGVRAALEKSSAEHIVVMSGSCYPLVSLEELEAELSHWIGRSMFELNPIPYAGWSTWMHPDGGSWRFTRRFATIDDNVVTVGGIPIALGRASVPPGLELYGSSHWKIYSRRHAQAILRILDEHPEQIRYWRSTWVPEESCIASLLKSTAFSHDLAETVCSHPAWFMRWPPPTHHPASLTLADFAALAAESARASPGTEAATSDRIDARPSSRKLFARKIGSDASDLLDRIDDRLRGAEPYLPPPRS